MEVLKDNPTSVHYILNPKSSAPGSGTLVGATDASLVMSVGGEPRIAAVSPRELGPEEDTMRG